MTDRELEGQASVCLELEVQASVPRELGDGITERGKCPSKTCMKCPRTAVVPLGGDSFSLKCSRTVVPGGDSFLLTQQNEGFLYEIEIFLAVDGVGSL